MMGESRCKEMGRHARPKTNTTTKRIALGTTVILGGSVVPVALAGSANAATAAEWDKVAQCESGGLWYRSDGHADSTGGLQIQDRTWADFGGTAIAPHAYQASKEQQIRIAEKILAAQGPRAWSVTWNGTCPGATLSRTPYASQAPTPPPAPTPPLTPKPSAPAPAPSDGVYVVEPGDYLVKIAAELKIDGGWLKLYELNKEAVGPNPHRIKPGLKLKLPTATAKFYTVVEGDSLGGIAEAHGVNWHALYGVNKETVGSDPNLILPGMKLTIPDGTAAPAKPKPAPAPKPKPSGYVLPVKGLIGDGLIISGSCVSRSCGGHSGLDITAPHGSPVLAASAGVVVGVNASGWAYGTHVIVKHADGVYTLYAHLSARSVSMGQTVAAGQQVGNVGSTGNSSGPHLHFEVRNHPTNFSVGVFLNPVTWLRSHGVTV